MFLGWFGGGVYYDVISSVSCVYGVTAVYGCDGVLA